MAKTKRCKRMEDITDELTDTVLGYYDEGRMEDFWDGVDSLQALLDVKVVTCGEHTES